MVQYNGSPEEFESWIIQMHQAYQLAFEQVYEVDQEEDLDLMLLHAMENQSQALEELRTMTEDYIHSGYTKVVDDFVSANIFDQPGNKYILRGFYSFLRTQGHSRPFAFQSLKWSANQVIFKTAPLALYQDIRTHLTSCKGRRMGRIPAIYNEGKDWKSLLEFWGVHLATEIRNDSFDTEIIGKKMYDFIVTMACLYTLLGI